MLNAVPPTTSYAGTAFVKPQDELSTAVPRTLEPSGTAVRRVTVQLTAAWLATAEIRLEGQESLLSGAEIASQELAVTPTSVCFAVGNKLTSGPAVVFNSSIC